MVGGRLFKEQTWLVNHKQVREANENGLWVCPCYAGSLGKQVPSSVVLPCVPLDDGHQLGQGDGTLVLRKIPFTRLLLHWIDKREGVHNWPASERHPVSRGLFGKVSVEWRRSLSCVGSSLLQEKHPSPMDITVSDTSPSRYWRGTAGSHHSPRRDGRSCQRKREVPHPLSGKRQCS